MPIDHGSAEPIVYTVQEFCQAHRISRGQLYALWREDKGPRRFTVGNKVLITVEDAAEWRRESVATTPKYDEAAAEWRRARPGFARTASHE
jgi:hypothetical protein